MIIYYNRLPQIVSEQPGCFPVAPPIVPMPESGKIIHNKWTQEVRLHRILTIEMKSSISQKIASE